MTGFPFTVDERGLAHVDEATRIREFFAREGTPISRQDAQRLAYLNWLVFTERLQVMGEPRRPFVSHDPRRSFHPPVEPCRCHCHTVGYCDDCGGLTGE